MNVKCSKGRNPTWRQLLTEAAAFKRPVWEKGVVMNRELVECLFSCLWCSDLVRSTYRRCICSKHFGYFLKVWDHCSWCLSWHESFKVQVFQFDKGTDMLDVNSPILQWLHGGWKTHLALPQSFVVLSPSARHEIFNPFCPRLIILHHFGILVIRALPNHNWVRAIHWN